MWGEEIELDGIFGLLFDPSANKHKAMGNVPGLRFPLRFEVSAPRLDSPPPAAYLDALLEFTVQRSVFWTAMREEPMVVPNAVFRSESFIHPSV